MTTKTRSTGYNSSYPKGRVSCSKNSFVVEVPPFPSGICKMFKWMRSDQPYTVRVCLPIYSEGEKIRFTQNKTGNVRYIFLYDFPQGQIEITKMKFDAKTTVQMLGDSKPLKWKKTANGVSITVPETARKKSDYVWVLKVQ